MRSFTRVLGVAALAITTTASGAALASDPSTAEHLFQQGLDAMKRNQYKEACDAFAGSNEADASPGTEINLALCNEKQSKLASAWGWYRTAAGLAEQRGQKDRADLARAEAVKLEPKLHKVVVSVKFPADGLTVTRNGAPVPSATLGSDVPIDPGDYVFEVTAKAKKPWKQTLHIAAAPGIDRIEVPALEDAPVEAAAPAAGGADYRPPVAEGRDGQTQRTIGFVIGGAGIVAGIVGIALEFLALREKDKSETDATKSKDLTVNPTDRAAYADSSSSHHDAAKSDELIAIISGAGGVVLIGVGVTLVLTAPSGAKSADLTKTRVVPLFGNGMTGLGLTGTF